jgi:outer membrane protein assembly factor BamB
MIAKHDKNRDEKLSRGEFPTLWIFHRPDGAEAPQNGATVRFEWADKNKDGKIAEDEWAIQARELDKYRAGYDTHGVLAIRLDGEGMLGGDQLRTLETQGIPEVPSPVCDGRNIYFVKNGGVLTCLELKTGELVYRKRTGGRGTHYASPLIADGKIFTIAGNGQISVLTLGPNPKLLATNDMQDGVYATPAIVDGTIYVRTHSALHAFAEARQ